MKIYEKPLAIINKFEIEDVIATSGAIAGTEIELSDSNNITGDTKNTSRSIVFTWD